VKYLSHLLAGVMVALLVTGGGIPSAECAETVKIGGTGSGLGVVRILAETFEKSHPGVSIKVIPSLGSTGGIRALLAGSLDLALSARPLTGEETASGGVAVEVARTPFVFIVNRSVSQKGITTGELEKIYGGGMPTWPDGTRLRLVLRPKTEADTDIVRRISPAMNRAVTSAIAREGMIRAVTDQDNTAMVEKTPGALGGAALTQICSENRAVDILSFNGITPSVKGIGDGSYPLSKSLYLVTTATTSPAARKFIDFIHSRAGTAILAKYGNLVVSPAENRGK
jgi:phosphate transport system substrate-binding protein